MKVETRIELTRAVVLMGRILDLILKIIL